MATEDEEKEFEDSLENAKRAGLGDHARNVKKISGEELDKVSSSMVRQGDASPRQR